MITCTRQTYAAQFNGQPNNRIVIATYGDKAILNHEGVREEWIKTTARGHHVLVIDGAHYEYNHASQKVEAFTA